MMDRSNKRRFARYATADSTVQGSLIARLYEVNWLLFALVFLIGGIGVTMIFAATDGRWNAGAFQHLQRLILGGCMMLTIALINIRVWYFLAYPIYGAAVILLGAVDFFGIEVNGSTRWLDFGVARLQPSEIMKLAIVLALARYYHDIFLAGVNWRVILGATGAAAIAIPIFYKFGLKDYQRERVNTLWNPEADPMGASYHIIQSKIALGSGGVSGKGFMQGTQRSGDYVPENTTDFIFTVIGEEFGLIGGIGTIAIYGILIAFCLYLSFQVKHLFSRLLILGVTTTFTLYVFINLAMVMGLIPVVGVPLPLISYGGTVIMTVMIGFGLILSSHLFRGAELPKGYN